MLRRLSLIFLPRYMRYTSLICTDEEHASKDLQRYVHPCLTNSLLIYFFIGLFPDTYILAYICQQFSRSNPAKCSCTGLPSPAYTRKGWLMAEVISPLKNGKMSNHAFFLFLQLFMAFFATTANSLVGEQTWVDSFPKTQMQPTDTAGN